LARTFTVHFSLEILDPSSLPKLDVRYNMFLGGIPDSVNAIAESVASKAPYIGCMRDVLIVPHLTDFNDIPYSAGVEFGVCKSEMPSPEGR
jgi:hypothetical protein